ncbi:MAG: hypothetical protein J0L53_05120 [Spirochaetes bacterium]|nr:hypothetical protein [Spirochaetota bacterium]
MLILRGIKYGMLAACVLFVPLGFAAKTEKPGNLARVAILEFKDNTGQASYGWVKKSLPDAINDSMKTHFEFLRADAAEADKSGDKLLGTAKEYSSELVAQMAKQYNFDIVIFGDFSYDSAKKLARISASVYHTQGGRIIGSVTEQTKLNNDVFNKIEVISKKIVENIYRFSLDLNEGEAAKRGDENIRLLVLVPTWTNDSEKKKAVAELDIQKTELKKKYQAEFLTIFEFFRKKNTPPPEQKSIETLAKARNDTAIADWLKGQKVTNAMIVFVSENRVSLRPVIDGSAKSVVSYATNAPVAEKAKSIDAAVTSSGMRDNLEKTALTAKPGIQNRLSIAGAGLYLKPYGTGDYPVSSGFGFEFQAQYRLINLWLFQLGVSGIVQGISQKNTRADGDPDFFTAAIRSSGRACNYCALSALSFP